MYKQLNLTDLLASIKSKIEAHTDLPCYDVPPDNEPSPLVYMEVVSVKPADTKTMFCKIYTVWLHVISEEAKSLIPIHHHIQHVEEALTEDIELPVGLNLIMQTDNGVQTIKTDETGEKHAVLEFEFKVNYGLKMK